MPTREFTTAPPRAATTGDAPSAAAAVFDPLRYCIFTTIALLGWGLGPAVMVVLTSAVGIMAYRRAMRAGLLRSRCLLGDTRLVMVYLVLAFVGGVVAMVLRFR